MKELLKIHKVLSDESRLRVLNLLFEGECCVCEVMQTLDFSQSKASRILTALHDAGIVTFRKEGLWSLYSLDREGMSPYLLDIIEATRKGFEDDTRMADDRERLKTAERVGPGCGNNTCRTEAQTGTVAVASSQERRA